jgi:hypothetical protein
VPGIHFEAEVGIGGGGIETFVLEVVGFKFVDEANAPAFLPKVDHDATLFGGEFKRTVELLATVAATGVEDIASHALGVDADEDGLRDIQFFMHQNDVRRQFIR